MSAVGVRGRFLWHELLTTDPDAASRFYAAVAGWEKKRWEQDSSYGLLATAGVPMAGLMALPAESRARGESSHWLTYIGVADVDAAVRLATEMGATVRSAAQDVPTVGRMAELADPQGAMFAVYAPASEQTGSEDLTLGDFSWHELAATNWQVAWEFYSTLFGWVYDSSFDMGPGGTYWMFRRSGGKRTIGGMYTKPPELPGPASWLPYVMVLNADQAATAAVRAGGKLLSGPMQVPGGDRVAVCSDPQGAGFAVHASKPAVIRKPAAAAAKRAAASKARRRSAGRVKKRAPKRAVKKAPEKGPKKVSPKMKAKVKAKAKKAKRRAGRRRR